MQMGGGREGGGERKVELTPNPKEDELCLMKDTAVERERERERERESS